MKYSQISFNNFNTMRVMVLKPDLRICEIITKSNHIKFVNYTPSCDRNNIETI